MRGDGSAERLAEGDDGFGIEMFRAGEVLIGRFGVEIQPSFVRLPFAAAVAAIFEGKHVGRRVAKELVSWGAIGDVRRVAVERKKREFCPGVGNPPGVKLCSIGSGEPNIFRSERAWMPVAFQASGIIREENHVALEEANGEQKERVGYEDVKQRHRYRSASKLHRSFLRESSVIENGNHATVNTG